MGDSGLRGKFFLRVRFVLAIGIHLTCQPELTTLYSQKRKCPAPYGVGDRAMLLLTQQKSDSARDRVKGVKVRPRALSEGLILGGSRVWAIIYRF